MSKWPMVTLGEVAEFRYGRSLSAANRNSGPVPVYGSNGLVGSHNASITSGPTIVIGRKGSFGEVNMSQVPCWPIDTTYYIDKNCTGADLRWLYHLLQNLGLTKLNRAAAVPGLNREDAYRKRLLLPQLSEQRRIAAILDKADELRSKRIEAMDHIDSLAQSLFLARFGNPLTNSMRWPVQPLGALGRLDRGISRHRPRNAPELLGGPYPLVQTGEVSNSGGYIRSTRQSYSEIGLKQSKVWPTGTLCITIAANIAKTAILKIDACFPDSVVGFVANDHGTVEYVRVLISFLQRSLEASAPESAQKNINLEILRKLPTPCPPVSERRRFSDAIQTMAHTQAAYYEPSLAQLDALFASLQARAFAGEL